MTTPLDSRAIMSYIYDVRLSKVFDMVNEIVRQGDLFKPEVIDIDQMATEAEGLRSVKGTTAMRSSRARKVWLEPVGKVVKPSFGGKIEAREMKLFDDGQDQFRCGR